MKYVIDSSVAFKWSVKEVDSDKADAILNDYLASIHELHAPDFFPVELAHSFTRAERQRRITQTDGALFFKTQLNTLPVLHFFASRPLAHCLRNLLQATHWCLGLRLPCPRGPRELRVHHG